MLLSELMPSLPPCTVRNKFNGSTLRVQDQSPTLQEKFYMAVIFGSTVVDGVANLNNKTLYI
jgi:hypothetical protein